MGAAVLLFFQGCASQAGFSQSFPKRLTETQSTWYFQHHGNPQFSPSSPDPGLQGNGHGLQPIMDRLVYASPLRGYSIPVAVLNDEKINAQTDGKTVYLNVGLLKAFYGHDDLVAAVCAHELGHILANHQTNNHKGGSALGYLNYLTPALNVVPYGGLYGSAAITAMQQGVNIHEYSYDRLQENEADAIGAILAADAGYNPLGLSQFLDYVGGSAFGVPKNISIPTSVGAIPQSALITVLSSSPLYKTHPPSKQRKEIIDLIIQRKKGLITHDELKKKSAWLADLYQSLELSRPRA